MCIALAIGGSVVMALVIALFKERPDEDARGKSSQSVDYSVLQSVKGLLLDRNFVLQYISHSFILAYMQAFTSLLIQIIGVYGFTSAEASYLTTGFMISGILGGVLTTTLITKYGTDYFRTASLIIIGGTLISKFYHFLLFY